MSKYDFIYKLSLICAKYCWSSELDRRRQAAGFQIYELQFGHVEK